MLGNANRILKTGDRVGTFTVTDVVGKNVFVVCDCGHQACREMRMFLRHNPSCCRQCNADKYRATHSRLFGREPMTRTELIESGRVKVVQ